MNTEAAISPYFSGGPWKPVQLTPLHDHSLSTTLLLEAAAKRREL